MFGFLQDHGQGILTRTQWKKIRRTESFLLVGYCVQRSPYLLVILTGKQRSLSECQPPTCSRNLTVFVEFEQLQRCVNLKARNVWHLPTVLLSNYLYIFFAEENPNDFGFDTKRMWRTEQRFSLKGAKLLHQRLYHRILHCKELVQLVLQRTNVFMVLHKESLNPYTQKAIRILF